MFSIKNTWSAKFVSGVATASLLVSMFASFAPQAMAADACGAEFVYTKTEDFSDSRVNINFKSNDTQIDVSASNGYEIIKVELDVNNDNKNGYFTYATGAVNNFNPNPGDDINSARITVRKTCNVTICHATGNGWSSITADSSAIDGLGNGDHNSAGHQNGEDIIPPGYWDVDGRNWDTEGQAVYNNNCVEPPTPPTDVCSNVSGVQTSGPCADEVCEDNGGTWSSTSCDMPPVDVCPNVSGNQPEGTACEDEICSNGGGNWNGTSCDPDVCPNDGGYQSAGPCTDEDVCPNDDGIQETGPCQSDDVCPNDSGIQLSGPCTDEDVCPNDDGIQTSTPCASDDVCPAMEGIQTNTEDCAEEDTENNPTPTDEQITCLLLGGTWEDNLCTGIVTFTICLLIDNEAMSLEDLEAALNVLGYSIDDFDCDGGSNETDHCSTVGGIQDAQYDCPSQTELDCENAGGTWNGTSCDMPTTPTQCADGIDNDNDGNIDSADAGCTDSSDNDENNDSSNGGSNGDSNSNSSSGGNGGGGGSKKSSGEILGASTDSCGILLTGYVGLGKANNLVDVVRLQLFLNEVMGTTLPVNGVYDLATKAIVDQFQLKHAGEVLAPWVPFGLPTETTTTGYIYKTTQRMINNIHCPSLNLPLPLLP